MATRPVADRLIRCDGVSSSLPHRRENTLSPRLPGQTVRSVLMGRTGTRIAFPAEAGSKNWKVPVTRPLLSSWFYTVANQNHVCSFHPAAQPGTSTSAAVAWTTCDRRKRSTPSLAQLLLESLMCISPGLSLGAVGGGRVESDSFLSPVPAPLLVHALPKSFDSTFTARWMWLGKYSRVSPGLRVISWHSGCHRFNREQIKRNGLQWQ